MLVVPMFIVLMLELPTTRLVVDGVTVVSGPPDVELAQAVPSTRSSTDGRR
jgi:hypothetical protein